MIELGKEYPTRGGGKAIVYRNDGYGAYPLLGVSKDTGCDYWETREWTIDGRVLIISVECPSDIILTEQPEGE